MSGLDFTLSSITQINAKKLLLVNVCLNVDDITKHKLLTVKFKELCNEIILRTLDDPIYPKQVQIVPLHIYLTKKLTSGVDIM